MTFKPSTSRRRAAFNGFKHWPKSSPDRTSRARVNELSLHGGSHGGYTLAEMVIVVALIGVIATVAVPALAPADNHKLDLAASAVADAFRYAREEARHTGLVHGVSADPSNNTVRVFRVDQVPDPNQMVFDVYQPVSKQLYTLKIGAPPYTNVVMSAVDGQLIGICNEPGSIAFDSSGVVRCAEPVTSRIRNARIGLALDNQRTTISVDEYTGRVSVQ